MKGKISIYVGIILISACSPKVIGIYNTDVANKSFRTYGLDMSSSSDAMSSEDQSLDSLIGVIISEVLEEKALKKSSIPDIYASYLVNIHSSSTDTHPNQNSFRSSNYIDPYYNNFTSQTQKAGVLIIDIRNDYGKLVWQGSKTFKVKSRQRIRDVLPGLCREVISAFEVNKRE